MIAVLRQWVSGFALVATSACATHLRAQTVCRPADALGVDLLQTVQMYVAATDSTIAATRDSLRLPSVAEGSVVLVTDEAVCKKAMAAYKTKLGAAGSGHSGRVYVIKAGTTYTVWDPEYRYIPAGEPRIRMVMASNNYKVLRTF